MRGWKSPWDRDFWLDEPGYYAVALDGDKRPVDADGVQPTSVGDGRAAAAAPSAARPRA